MRIDNSYKDVEVSDLTKTIKKGISSFWYLAQRSKAEIQDWINNKYLYLIFEDEDLAGFVVKQPITDNFWEINSLFIYKKYRGAGMAVKAVFRLTRKKGNYVAASYNKKAVKTFERAGFRRVRIYELPLKVIIKYLLTRKISSVIRSIKNKTYFFYKTV